jgi:thiosulfate reductase cytochrome b subunit
MNPLQQVTYLVILNVLLPAQVVTGVLIWGMQKWPEIAQMFGGLPVLAPLHTILAWAFATFIVMHVYLTTAAGEHATDGIKAMIQGWDDVELPSSQPQTESRKEK